MPLSQSQNIRRNGKYLLPTVTLLRNPDFSNSPVSPPVLDLPVTASHQIASLEFIFTGPAWRDSGCYVGPNGLSHSSIIWHLIHNTQSPRRSLPGCLYCSWPWIVLIWLPGSHRRAGGLRSCQQENCTTVPSSHAPRLPIPCMHRCMCAVCVGSGQCCVFSGFFISSLFC